MRVASPLHWEPPLDNVFKLNFDGASKGNPGKAGYGGAIKYHNGNITLLFYGSIGLESNNVVELEGMVVGLIITNKMNLLPLIMEGNS